MTLIRAVVGAVLLASLSVSAAPRPISDAEHAAVRIAADYLSGGPVAVVPHLASTSSLRKFAQSEQLAEIEVRFGPREGAVWELQTVVPALADRTAAFAVEYPSGLDDALIFDMVKEGGTYKLADVHFLALPLKTSPLFPQAETSSEQTAKSFEPYPLALLAAVLSIAAVFTARKGALRFSMIGIAALLVIGATALRIRKDFPIAAASAVSAAKQDDAPPKLATLLPLRRALAIGTGDIAAAFKTVDRAHGCGAIADLWKIQWELQQTNIAEVKPDLARFPSPSSVPLVEILRGRVALLENSEVASAIAFESAVNLGPGRDGIWYETAGALMALGYDDRAESYFSRLARMGSREAEVYYSLAVIAAAKGEDEEAEKWLVEAWNLQPVEREHLFSAGVLWSVLRRERMTSLISLSAPVDPVVLAPAATSRAIQLPHDAMPETAGQYLYVRIGEQELHVPGGAALAPVGTPAVAATAWARAEEERRLADLPQLLSFGRSAAAYAQPALRSRITRTASTLADRNRWSDVVQLTENLTAASEHVPPSIFFLRSIGLQRMHRGDEANRLLIEVAASKSLQRKRDAAALIELAELFAAQDLFDAAVRMYDRSQSIRQNPSIDDRVRQIQMNKRLATKYSVHKTEHFEIRFPDDVSPMAAMELGQVMERELKRLQEWIPVPQFKPTVVNVVWWQDFRSTYTGNDYILGFYNGKITVPFAGAPELNQFLVNILSHELAHALIAQATNENAPHWFQEGLAQRIEQRPFHENAFNMYDDNRLLPVSLLDAVLKGSPDPDMVGAAYIVSQTDIRYIEAKYGRNALRKLLENYRDGMTTEQALTQVSGKSPSAFETDLRQWGRSEQRVFENPVEKLKR